jgi:hypothetical protein
MTGDDRGAANERAEVVRRVRRVIVVSIVVVVTLIAVAVWKFSPLAPGPGTPVGATRLRIATETPHLVPALGCPLALLAPVRLQVVGEDLLTISIGTGEPVSVVWPSGWAAWRVDGRAELHGRDGALIAREGDVIADRFGGGIGTDDVFHVCIAGG